MQTANCLFVEFFVVIDELMPLVRCFIGLLAFLESCLLFCVTGTVRERDGESGVTYRLLHICCPHMLCLALPKDEQSEDLRVGARPCTSAARPGNFGLIQVNSFCCSFSHRWPGVGRTRRECSVGALVILCDNHSLPSWLSDLLSTHTLGANVASRVLLCRMTAKR